MTSLDFLNIDDTWDCDSIERKLQDLRESRHYSGDFMLKIDERIDTLERRKIELGC